MTGHRFLLPEIDIIDVQQVPFDTLDISYALVTRLHISRATFPEDLTPLVTIGPKRFSAAPDDTFGCFVSTFS